jgi:hypothetical protein
MKRKGLFKEKNEKHPHDGVREECTFFQVWKERSGMYGK